TPHVPHDSDVPHPPPGGGLSRERERRKLALAAASRRRGGTTLFLESNSRVKPALSLDESAGFVHQPAPRPGSHYARADVYMIHRPNAKARAARRR
ncbi:MAG TPA: hypothetical protein VJ696_02530, partial [Rhodanobacteraceae bacterium]|nr:hypothetical protein [Rhodanobacteraceae bacterium]